MSHMRSGGLLFVAVVALAACGGSSHSTSISSTTTTVPANNATGNGGLGNRLAGFRTCMADHGIELPRRPRRNNAGTPSTEGGGSGGGGGIFGGGGGGSARFNQPPPGVDPTKYQDALNACRGQLPTGGNFNNSAFQAYRSCLQDHGVTLPAQGQNTTGTTFNRNDPKVRAAMQTCRPLLPNGFGGTTTTTTGTT